DPAPAGNTPEAQSLDASSMPVRPDESVRRVQQIAAQANGNKRARAVAGVAEGLEESQIRAALAELERTHLREREEITLLLITRWGRLNPRAAVDYAKSIKIARNRELAIRAALKGWAETAIAAANAR